MVIQITRVEDRVWLTINEITANEASLLHESIYETFWEAKEALAQWMLTDVEEGKAKFHGSLTID